MPNQLAAIESLPPIDRLTVRLAEWARSIGRDVIDPLGVPGQTWVGPTRVTRADPGALPDGAAQHERPTPLRESYVQFVIDRVSKEVSVRIIDRASGEVIRTIPPEDILKMLYDSDVQTGTLVQTHL